MKDFTIFNIIDIQVKKGNLTNPNYRNYLKEYRLFQSQLKDDFEISNNYPCLLDKYANAGIASGQYFIQDIFVAQQILKNNPTKHADIGSRIDGFVAHIACFREIEIFDIRPLTSNVKNIVYKQLDITEDPVDYYNYCDSISCLHALEHFGLGRYGDTLDVNGHKKGLINISKILKPGGLFYLSVPFSNRQRIEFNAHRIFKIPYLLELLNPLFDICSVSYIDDTGSLKEDVDIKTPEFLESFNCDNGCVIFILKKHIINV